MSFNDRNPIVVHQPRRDLVPASDADWPPSQPSPEGESFDKNLMKALKRRWLLASTLGVLVAALGVGAMWFTMPPTYTSRALLHLSMQPGRGVFMGQDVSETAEEFLAYQRTQSALIKSRDIVQAALRQPQVAECRQIQSQGNPVQWLSDSLRVEAKLGPEVLTVSLSGQYPEDLAVILNGVIQAYIQDLTNRERLKQPARLEQLSEKYRQLSEALRRKRATLRDLETNLGVEPQQMTMFRFQAALQHLAATEKEAMQSKVALKNAQLELALLKERNDLSDTALSVDMEQYLARDETYKILLAQKTQIEEENGRIRTIAASNVREQMTSGSKNQLTAIEKELAARRKAILPLFAAQERTKLEVRVAVLAEQQKEIAAELQQQQSEVKRLSEAIRQPDKPSSDLDALRDEVALADQVVKKVGEQRDMWKIEPARPARVSVLEEADVPSAPDVKQQTKLAGMMGMGLFGLVVMGVCLREFFAGRVYSESDVVHSGGMSLLGTVPALQRPPLMPPVSLNGNLYEQALLTVSVDVICDRLMRERQENGRRVFMVTSARRDEGKTFLAMHLAARLAFSGCKTLFIDCDLFHPQVHTHFNVSAEPGFSAVLRGDLDLPDAMWPTPLPELWLIPAGKWSSDAVMALANEKGKIIFDYLKPDYDFIIVNASPVLTGADALLLAKHADGVIISVQREVSQVAPVRNAYQCLVNIGATVLGTAIIGEDVMAQGRSAGGQRH